MSLAEISRESNDSIKGERNGFLYRVFTYSGRLTHQRVVIPSRKFNFSEFRWIRRDNLVPIPVDGLKYETEKRWKMIIYMAMSLLLVNISLPAIRIYLIVKFKAIKPSRVFLGKNLIFFFVQTLKLCKAVKEYFDDYEERLKYRISRINGVTVGLNFWTLENRRWHP